MSYVPQSVKTGITLVDGIRTVEEIVQESGRDPEKTSQILRELINDNILELFEK